MTSVDSVKCLECEDCGHEAGAHRPTRVHSIPTIWCYDCAGAVTLDDTERDGEAAYDHCEHPFKPGQSAAPVSVSQPTRCPHTQIVSVYGEHRCALEHGHAGAHKFQAGTPDPIESVSGGERQMTHYIGDSCEGGHALPESVSDSSARERARRFYSTTLIGDALEIAVQAYVEGAQSVRLTSESVQPLSPTCKTCGCDEECMCHLPSFAWERAYGRCEPCIGPCEFQPLFNSEQDGDAAEVAGEAWYRTYQAADPYARYSPDAVLAFVAGAKWAAESRLEAVEDELAKYIEDATFGSIAIERLNAQLADANKRGDDFMRSSARWGNAYADACERAARLSDGLASLRPLLEASFELRYDDPRQVDLRVAIAAALAVAPVQPLEGG